MRYLLARLVLAYDMEFPSGFDAHAFRDGLLNMRTTVMEKELVMRFVPRVDLGSELAARA